MGAIGRLERGQNRMAAGIQELVSGQKELMRVLQEGQEKMLESLARLQDARCKCRR